MISRRLTQAAACSVHSKRARGVQSSCIEPLQRCCDPGIPIGKFSMTRVDFLWATFAGLSYLLTPLVSGKVFVHPHTPTYVRYERSLKHDLYALMSTVL